MRLWDVFLYDGSEILLLIALAIFKLFEEVPPRFTHKPFYFYFYLFRCY
jgi:hypothetical protein